MKPFSPRWSKDVAEPHLPEVGDVKCGEASHKKLDWPSASAGPKYLKGQIPFRTLALQVERHRMMGRARKTQEALGRWRLRPHYGAQIDKGCRQTYSRRFCRVERDAEPEALVVRGWRGVRGSV